MEMTAILDPRIAEWNDHGTTPARMVDLLGLSRDLAKLNIYANECGKLLVQRTNVRIDRGRHASTYWCSEAPWNSDGSPCVKQHEATSFLRCLFANPNFPREMVECPECGGSGWRGESNVCDCIGGYIGYATRILPGWKSPRVMDLARAVRGTAACKCTIYSGTNFYRVCMVCNKPLEAIEPQPIHNILADALQDEGCDDAELIRHLYDGPHVDGQCYVAHLLLEGITNG
jgi:hypothetical protein